eukprot:GDKH01016138.1.p1 GENE.GDKH01016138.1~~GDKH01016138.1.p1  ORF type:complete len:181 (-),score=29.22 GDKH01016138.1:106-648(-)
MRPLTEEETKLVFEKLSKFLGHNLIQMVDSADQPHVFRLHKERVYYMSEAVLKMAGHVPKKQLVCAGTVLGRFSKTRKFRLTITCLDYLARFAKYKLWVKPGGEQAFLYGNSVVKRHLGRITENTPKNAGVVIFSMSDVPLGFGVTSRSTAEMRSADTEAVVAHHQADVGEYLREEADLL